MSLFQSLKHLTKTLTLFLTLTLLTILISLPLKTYHTLITILKTIFKNKLQTQLTPYDAIFATDAFHTHPHAANITLIYVDGRITREQVLERFETLLNRPNFVKLKQLIVNYCGYYYWKEDCGFNLQNHINETELERDTDDCLFKYLSNQMVKGFAKSTPLWEVVVVSGYKGQSVVVLRIHHCYADGYSQNFIVDSLLGVRSGYFVRESRDSGWRGKLSLLARSPHMLSTLYREALTQPPNHYTNKKVSTTGVLAITSLSLDKWKQIRRKTNTHFASIGMSLMCGALNRYYTETNSPDSLPKSVGIMHSLPKPGHPLNKLVNHWGVGLFRVPIITTDPLERLLKAEENFKSYTNQGYDELLHWHMPILGWFPSVLLRRFFNINFGTSMGFTSVPGWGGGGGGGEEWGWSKDNNEGSSSGRVLGLGKVFGFQWGQTAIATAVYTHTTTATITIYANKDIVPDQEAMNRVRNYLVEEFDSLYKLTEEVYGRKAEKLG